MTLVVVDNVYLVSDHQGSMLLACIRLALCVSSDLPSKQLLFVSLSRFCACNNNIVVCFLQVGNGLGQVVVHIATSAAEHSIPFVGVGIEGIDLASHVALQEVS